MKIVAFSDLHAHPFKAYDSYDEKGRSRRLMDAISCIDQVTAHAEKVKADAIFFCGDLFHERRHIITSAFNEVMAAMKRMVDTGIPVYALDGNHDQADRAGKVHALTSLEYLGVSVLSPGSHEVMIGMHAPTSITCIPYTEDLSLVRELTYKERDSLKTNILLAHVGVVGADIGADFVYRAEAEPTLEDLHTNNFDLVLIGHFHKHQKMAHNTWFIGSPLQHNWGDRGQPRGLVEITIDESSVPKTHLKHVVLDAPQFVEVKHLDYCENQFKNNYVRVIGEEQESDLLKGARSVEFIDPPEKKAKKERLIVDEAGESDDIMRQYIEYLNPKLDHDDLLAIGVSILSEVTE